LALEVMAQNGTLLAENDRLNAAWQRKTHDYDHLLHSTKGAIREDHETLCRKYREAVAELQELYPIVDECRELRSKLARMAA
jgi:hypothetical protein